MLGINLAKLKKLPSVIKPKQSCRAVGDAVARLVSDPRFTPARVARVLGDGELPDYRLPVDVYTTADEIVVLASMPQVPPEDIQITVKGDVLTLQGVRRTQVQNVSYVMRERRWGRFRRRLVLNVPVDAERARASVSQGVLTVVLPTVSHSRSPELPVPVQELSGGE
jgi:HSP20 family protein